jgi:hypothetical protein
MPATTQTHNLEFLCEGFRKFNGCLIAFSASAGKESSVQSWRQDSREPFRKADERPRQKSGKNVVKVLCMFIDHIAYLWVPMAK